ncbi:MULTISPECIES: DMT family transporter [unclassified Luteococcus]|uniref:DMT family transporter n=1 Tax=unclassified Luteococcus TaxID=2639923 RepID=UPI00313EF5BF
MSTSATPRSARHTRYLALGALVLMGVLWGSTFFSMKDLTSRIPVPDLLAVRFIIAAVVSGALGWRHWRMNRRTLRHGTILGLIYGTAQLVQTVGLAHTAASVSGFVTGLYVVFTPFLAAWLLRERVPLLTWLSVLLAALGLGVLTLDLSAGVVIGVGELLTLGSAVIYACHIVAVDRWSDGDNSLSLTLVTLTVVALECTVAALPGGIHLPSGGTDWAWMLYIAVIAGAIPIFLQVWAQAVVESTTAAVLMAGEPVWAAVFAVLLGGERFTWQMLAGGGSMFAAMILVTVLPKFRSRGRLLEVG